MKKKNTESGGDKKSELKMCSPQGIMANIIGKAMDAAFQPVKCVIHYKKNHKDLKDEMEKFKEYRKDIERKVEVAQNRGEDIVAVVSSWRREADEMTQDFENFMQECTRKESILCFACSCPNFIWRYRLSKQAQEKKDNVTKLKQEGHFDEIALPKPPPPGLQFQSDDDYEIFDSRASVFKMVVDALKDSKVTVIGVHGTGGVGKTTLVKQISKQVKEDRTFDEVVMAVVSKDASVSKIQSQLVGSLNLDRITATTEEQTSYKLWHRLNNGKKNLVILDDIWKEVNLKAIGIPVTDGNKGCKVVITSRNRDVLRRNMKVDRDFALPLLSEPEAWTLFKKVVGNSVDETELYSLAHAVCKECKGLPVAINALGAALKDKEIYAWKNALGMLKRFMKAEHLPENLRGKEADGITTPLFGESVPIIKDEMKSTTEEMNSQENEERTINAAGCLHGKSSLPAQDKLKLLEHELTLQEEEITQTEVMPEQSNEAKAIGVASFKEFIPGISAQHESEHAAECEIVQVPVAESALTAERTSDSSIETELEIEMVPLSTEEILPVDEFKSAFVSSEIEGLQPILKIIASETERELQPKPERSVDPTMLIMTSVKGRWVQCIDLQLVVFHCGQLKELHNVIKDPGFGDVLLGEDDYLVFVRSNEKIKKPPIFEGESSSIVSLGRPNTPNISFPEGFILWEAGKGLTESPLEENWEQPCVIALMKNEFSSLPTKPNCPNLGFLFLQNNRFLRTISDSFFDDMPSLEVLDLSKTRVRSLPASLFKLTGLQALFICDCNSLDELPPEVGNLEQIEVLDLWGTEVYNLPDEIAKLKHLRSLRVSFYGPDDDSEYDYRPSALISSGIISELVSLESLSIAVHPLDWRWTNNAEAIARDVCSLGKLIYLQFHFPGVNCLELFIKESLSWNACHLGKFKFVVGKDINRLVSRVPDNVESEYYKHERCLRFVNGDGIPREIAGVLERVTAFYLDHHWVMKSLSEFGISIFKELKFCIVSECPNLVEISNSTERTESVLPCLQHLSMHYLWRLERIWRGPVAPGSLDSLKVLSVHTCPRLEFIVAWSILHCLSNLEELVVEDCASVKVIIEMDCQTVSYGATLPCLKEIKLRYLPQLVSLSNGVCPISAHISVYSCPKLKNSHNLTTKDIEAQNIPGMVSTGREWDLTTKDIEAQNIPAMVSTGKECDLTTKDIEAKNGSVLIEYA
ncbi:disease resistance protein At4g27190-like [Actinidia eriantha]|uniref:disease resistance protein At4g27190-like n=1 Tax=Actinidia eriantha TaxID=165200 RepID=UPI00258FCD69|nr:disease resistance protein At4g27190-like [Actinidia eriantha]XP_057499668.1 disease resistance protein At4g27190-like [Actinidia eriantha]